MLATLKNGFTVYRLRCKNGSFISVQTRGFFEFDPQTNQPSTFVCINDVIRLAQSISELTALEYHLPRLQMYVYYVQCMAKVEMVGCAGIAASQIFVTILVCQTWRTAVKPASTSFTASCNRSALVQTHYTHVQTTKHVRYKMVF